MKIKEVSENPFERDTDPTPICFTAIILFAAISLAFPGIFGSHPDRRTNQQVIHPTPSVQPTSDTVSVSVSSTTVPPDSSFETEDFTSIEASPEKRAFLIRDSLEDAINNRLHGVVDIVPQFDARGVLSSVRVLYDPGRQVRYPEKAFVFFANEPNAGRRALMYRSVSADRQCATTDLMPFPYGRPKLFLVFYACRNMYQT